jgi:two-component system, sensor histidine kinase and response regulator
MRTLIIFILIFVASLFESKSQTQKIDSLIRILNSNKQKNKIRVDNLNELALEYQHIDLEKTYQFIKEAEGISVELNYKEGIANSFFTMGFYYWNKGSFDTTIVLCTKALEIFTTIKNYEGQIKCLNRIAVIHMYKGDYKSSIENYFSSIELSERTKNYNQMGKIYNNLGSIYSHLGDYEKALEYNFKALEIKKMIKDTFSIGVSLDNIGFYYLKQEKIDSAFKYSRQSLNYNKQIQNNYIIGSTYQNLAGLHDLSGNYDSAMIYYNLSIGLLKNYGNLRQLSNSYTLIANHYLLIKDYQKAIEFAKKALSITLETEEKEYTMNTSSVLYKAYGSIGDYKNAYFYFNQFQKINDELKNERIIKKLAFQEKELELKLQKEKSDLALSNQKKGKWLILSALILTLFIAFFIAYNLYRKIKSNQRLKKANDTRDKMFKIISHDFRSPLISIGSTLQVIPELIKVKDYDSVIDLAEKNEESVQRVLSLIDNLINWTLSQNDDIPYNPDNYSLKEITAFIFDIYTPIANYKKLKLYNKIPDSAKIFADKNILNTILRNLVNNAIKFTPENGKIIVDSIIKDNHLIIKVTDTGIGIQKSKLEKIFDLDKDKSLGTKGEKGNGLGLFFCKEFARKNQGDIWVESTPGVGSIFYFSVPLASN